MFWYIKGKYWMFLEVTERSWKGWMDFKNSVNLYIFIVQESGLWETILNHLKNATTQTRKGHNKVRPKGSKVEFGCSHTKSNAAAKTQRFLFIFNGSSCGTAATVGAWSRSPAQVFLVRRSPRHAATASLTAVQHSELHNSTTHNGLCYVNYARLPLLNICCIAWAFGL